ncbi:type II CRISPR RNA-guided endonuclease Cas9 [Sphingomonas sp. MMS24-JH45]
MWEELNPANPLDRRCPYCGEQIGIHALFTAADVDHVIPYSRSLDDSASNKVVAHRHCNRAKGNRTPFEKWGHDPERWETISAQVARLAKGKQWRFGPDAIARVEKDGGFLARQLTDTQYLAPRRQVSAQPLSHEGGRQRLRHSRPDDRDAAAVVGLNDILRDHNYVDNRHSNAPKNRLDHRHHAIDAAVTAVTTRSLLQQIARAAGQAEDQDLDRLFVDLPQPWAGFREELRDRLDAVTVSHKADHGRRGAPDRHRDVTAGSCTTRPPIGLTGEVNRKGDALVVYRIPLMSIQPKDLTDPERIPTTPSSVRSTARPKARAAPPSRRRSRISRRPKGRGRGCATCA